MPHFYSTSCTPIYERLRRKKPNLRELGVLYKLPELLIQARLSKGLSHEKLGELTGLKKQQIQRYEQTNYASASLTRLVEIARALENFSVGSRSQNRDGDTIDIARGLDRRFGHFVLVK